MAGSSKDYVPFPLLWHAPSKSASLPRLVASVHNFVEGIEGEVWRAKHEFQAAQNRMAQRVNECTP
jgi:hypothetical protein